MARGRQRNIPGWVARKRAGTKTARAAEAALDRAQAGDEPRSKINGRRPRRWRDQQDLAGG